MVTFPAAKFLPPPLPHGFVARKEVIDQLQRLFPFTRLTVFCAPPGYGKTTMMAMIPSIVPHHRYVWITVESTDDDPVVFFSAIGKAFEHLSPQCYQTIQNMLAQMPSIAGSHTNGYLISQIFTTVIEVMQDSAIPTVLMFDDLHYVQNQAIYNGLQFLIDQSTPQFHIVITTRHTLPLKLHRLRARRHLQYFDARSLQFDAEDTRQMLETEFHLNVNEAELLDLHQRSEGWPVGIVLLAMSLRDTQDIVKPATLDSATFDYFAEEVFATLPEQMQSFLLDICVLDELTPSLCDALSQRSDSANMLKAIQQHNLFLSMIRPKTIEQEPLFRFHSLFVRFLQGYLLRNDPDRYRLLMRSAAELEPHDVRAMAIFLRIQDWQSAIERIEKIGEQLLEQGLQETILGWMKIIPSQIRNNHLTALWLYGYAAFFSGDLELALQCFHQVNTLVNDAQDMEHAIMHGQIAVALASIMFALARFEECHHIIAQLESSTFNLQIELNYLMLRSSLALFWQGEWTRASLDLQRAITLVQSSNREHPHLWYQLALYLGPEFTQIPNGQALLESFCIEARQLPQFQHMLPLQLAIDDTWSGVCLRSGRVAEAYQTAQRALAIQQQLGGYTFLGANSAITLAFIELARSAFDVAEHYVQLAVKLTSKAPLHHALLGGSWYFLARLRFLQGRYDDAQEALQALDTIQQPLPHIQVLKYILFALLETNRSNFQQAEQCLALASNLAGKAKVYALYGSISNTYVYLYTIWGRIDLAKTYFQQGLQELHIEKSPGAIIIDLPILLPFLRLSKLEMSLSAVISRICADLGVQITSITAQIPQTQLTERQLEILQLIAEGHSNQYIAAQCSLSLATVKTHIVHIMDRLGARSRTEAVAIARNQRLLG